MITVELRQLTYFLAVAEHRSFTRAAVDVHVVQSALSVSIRTLEHELGAQLFHRTTHQVELTDAGRAFVPEARKTLAAADAARDAVADVQGGLRGTLRLGIMYSLAIVDLAGLLTRFHAERPHVRIEPSPAAGGSAELVSAIVDGHLDLAFAGLPGAYPPSLRSTLLASEPMGLACPLDHPLARRRVVRLEELNGETFLDFPTGWGTRSSVDQLFLQHDMSRAISVEIADIAVFLDLIRAGFGLAFLPHSLLMGATDIMLRQVRPQPNFRISLIHSSSRALSPAARAFRELALGVAQISKEPE